MQSILPGVNSEALVAEAHERVREQLEALLPAQLLQVNLDVSAAVTTVLGVLPQVNALRSQLQALPAFDLAAFDRLEDYALGLSFAQAEYSMVSEPPDDLPALSAEATRLRAMLLADARSLAIRGTFERAKLAQLKGRRGYLNVAEDLQALALALEETLVQIEGKAATTLGELHAASRIAVQLKRVVGLREHAPKLRAAASERRRRAFTQLLRVYEDARCAIQYLQAHHGDADSIAPSLYRGRPRRRKTATSPDQMPARIANAGADAAIEERAAQLHTDQPSNLAEPNLLRGLTMGCRADKPSARR